jgi:hypothetical protein
LRPGELLLRIDDREARYPLRIDPFIQQAKLTASDGASGDQLGGSVAVFGDTVVAGAPGVTVAGRLAQGAAYVFVKPAGGWASETEAAKLTASDGAAGDQLGASVAVSGDTVVAGAPGATGNSQFAGATYVFVKPAGGWASETEAAKLTASDGATGDALGASAGVSGDTVVAGAQFATVNGHPFQGAAYVFAPLLHTTTTTVGCSPSSVAVARPTTCAATVTDTAGSGQTTPTGTVGFTSTGPGAFTGSPCTLIETSPGVASCSVSYTPSPSGTPTRSDTITAAYSADSTHKSSNASTSVTVQPTSKDDCKKAGWQNYGFPNQGQCIKFVHGG